MPPPSQSATRRLKRPRSATIDEFLDLISKPFATLAVAVEGVVDFLDIAPDQRELGLNRIRRPGGYRREAMCRLRSGACRRELDIRFIFFARQS